MAAIGAVRFSRVASATRFLFSRNARGENKNIESEVGEMFDCGKKIQGFARFYLVIGTIASFFVAFGLSIALNHAIGDGFALLILPLFVVTWLSVYIVFLFLKGFGLIVENNEEQMAA